jgi:membrane protein implicated in regulation of membrane protease activity
MKAQYLFVPLFVLSAVLLVDFMFVVAIGVIANLFGATGYFFQMIFPYVITAIVATSIVVLTISLVRKYLITGRNASKIRTIQSQDSVYLGRTA